MAEAKAQGSEQQGGKPAAGEGNQAGQGGQGGQGPEAGKEKSDAELDEEARKRQSPENDPREQMLARIAAENDARIEEQLAAEGLTSRTYVPDDADLGNRDEPGEGNREEQQPVGMPAPPAAPRPARARTAAPAIDPQLLAQLGEEPLPAEALDNLRFTMKVDGKDQVFTFKELRRTAQLDGAAQTRLEQANNLLAQVQALVAKNGGAAPAAGPAAGPTAGPAPTQPPVGGKPNAGQGDSTGASQDASAAAKTLVQALFVGDEDAATAAMLDMQGRQNPQVDIQAIARQLAPVLRQQMSQEEAEAQFRSDFKDIVADPILVSAADRFYEEAARESPHKPYAELLTEAGTRTQEWLVSMGAAKPATGSGTGSTREEKLKAKQSIDTVRGLSRTGGSQDEVIQTASQTIAEMRAQRGLG